MTLKTTGQYKNLPEKEQQFIKNLVKDYPTNPLKSKEQLAQQISKETSLKLTRKSISRIFDLLNVPEKSAEEIKKSKAEIAKQKTSFKNVEEKAKVYKKILENYNNNVEDFKKEFNKTSLTRISNKIDVSIYYLRMFCQDNNIDVVLPVNYKDVINILNNKGYSREDVEYWYLDKENDFKKFLQIIYSKTGIQMNNTSTYRMLNHLNITKPPENIAYQQGSKSRKELLHSLDLLKEAGFFSTEELAEYYSKNIMLTYKDLVRILNERIDEEFFTTRWLERHMAPKLPENHLTGVSRGELGVLAFVKTLYDGEIISNDRELIKPKEIDILIPEKKIGIEFNGNYYHSDKFFLKNKGITSQDYHIDKMTQVLNKGYKLGFVWEDDWNNDSDRIKEFIKNFVFNNFLHKSLLIFSKG